MTAAPVTVAAIVNLFVVGANAQAPLKRGMYVDQRVHCDAGHAYNYYEFDGDKFLFGAPPVSEKIRRVSVSIYSGEYRSDGGRLVRDRFGIKSPTRFTWVSRGHTYHVRYCPNSSLPRDMQEPSGSH